MDRIGSLSPGAEDKLLLALSRTSLDEHAIDRIKVLTQGEIDWSLLIERAIHHRVLPLLYRSLHDSFPEVAPSRIADVLQQHYETNGQRNLFLTAVLHTLLDFLDRHGIDAISYKGPSLASVAYNNLALRQFTDLDLLVEPHQYEAARKLFLASGYRQAADWGWESTLIDDKRGVRIDLHRTLTPEQFPIHLNFSTLWKGLRATTIAGRQFKVLDPEDMFLVLCIQLSKDAWEGNLKLSKVCDIAELLRAKADLDWPVIYREASRLGCRRIVSLGLVVAHELLGAPVSEPVLARAHADSHSEALKRAIYQDLFGTSQTDVAPPSREAFYFKLRERWRDKLFPHYYDFRLRLIPNQRDRAFLPLPDSLHSLYYLIRPIRLARDYAWKLLRRR